MQKFMKRISFMFIILAILTFAVPMQAHAAATTYSVTYHANGGKNAPAKQEKISRKKSVSIRLSGKKPVREGYEFTKWDTKKSGNGKSYKPGAKVTLKRNNKNMQLYAVWKPYKTGEKTISVSEPDPAPEVPSGTLEVHYIDVGQGDCTLLLCDGEAMLIDAGDNSKGTAVQSYLQSKGVSELRYAVGTHPDADHIGGLDVVITKFAVKTLFMSNVAKDTRTYDDVIQAARYKNLKITNPAYGSEYKLGSAVVKFVSSGNSYGDNVNNSSLCMKVTYGSTSFLFTGDAEEEAENDMLHAGIQADVYMAAHHGSRTGSVEKFVDTVNPKYAVISCGKDNPYGHPHAATLNTFRNRNIKVFRTDEQGTIIAISDGVSIKWNTSESGTWTAGNQSVADSDEEGIYVLNKNTKVFHKPSCSSVAKMSEKNKETFSGKTAILLQEGYKPCGICF